MRLSECYAFLCQKSLAYLLSCKALGAVHEFIKFKDQLRRLLPDFVASNQRRVSAVKACVANIEDIEEGLSSLLDAFNNHPIHRTPIILRDNIAKLKEFVERYESEAKFFKQFSALSLEELRKYGSPWYECGEVALYISKGGKICVPRVLSWRITNNLADLAERMRYSIIETAKEERLADALLDAYVLQELISRGYDFRKEKIYFAFVSNFSRVPHKHENEVVAVPVKKYAEEIDACAELALVKSVFDS
ncbi:MAG: hypothetical protein QXE23_08655 [Nitrososphaerota archaeon]